MPKILLFANSCWFFHNYRIALIRRLRDEGWTVVVLAPVDRYVTSITEAGARVIDIRLSRKGLNPFLELRTALRVLRVYRQERPDVVHHFTIKPIFYGSLAARILRVRACLNSILGLGSAFTRGGFLRRLLMTLYRVALHRRCHVVFLNRDDRALFEQLGLVSRDRSHLILGDGVDRRDFRPDQANPAEQSEFVMVGRMLWDKGIAEFVEAARKVKRVEPSAKFYLLGDPDPGNVASVPEQWLMQQQAAGHVVWLGHREDVREVLRHALAVVLPSYREGLPKALVEAAAMAKPLIATDVAGCREVVEDGVNGILVPPRDSDALANAMLRLLRNPGWAHALGAASCERVIRLFDVERITRETLAVYSNALAGHAEERWSLSLADYRDP